MVVFRIDNPFAGFVYQPTFAIGIGHCTVTAMEYVVDWHSVTISIIVFERKDDFISAIDESDFPVLHHGCQSFRKYPRPTVLLCDHGFARIYIKIASFPIAAEYS